MMFQQAHKSMMYKSVIFLIATFLIGLIITNILLFFTSPSDENTFTEPPSHFYLTKDIEKPISNIIENVADSSVEKQRARIDTARKGSLIVKIDDLMPKDTNEFLNFLDLKGEKDDILLTTQDPVTGKKSIHWINKTDIDEGVVSYLTSAALIVDIIAGGVSDRAGIKVGDIIISINGNEFSDIVSLDKEMLKGKSGEYLTYKILREGESSYVSLKLASYGIPFIILLQIIFGSFFPILAIFLLIGRWDIKSARSLGYALFIIGVLFEIQVTRNIPDANFLNSLNYIIRIICFCFSLPLILHAHLYYPREKTEILQKKLLVYIPFIYSSSLVAFYLIYYIFEFSFFFPSVELLIIPHVTYKFILSHKYKQVVSPETRRFVRPITIIGMVVLVELLLKQVLMYIYTYAYIYIDIILILTILQYIELSLILITPIVYLYIIVKHKYFNVNLKLRKNVQYNIVTAAWRIVSIIILIIGVWMISSISVNIPDIVFTGSSLPTTKGSQRPVKESKSDTTASFEINLDEKGYPQTSFPDFLPENELLNESNQYSQINDETEGSQDDLIGDTSVFTIELPDIPGISAFGDEKLDDVKHSNRKSSRNDGQASSQKKKILTMRKINILSLDSALRKILKPKKKGPYTISVKTTQSDESLRLKLPFVNREDQKDTNKNSVVRITKETKKASNYPLPVKFSFARPETRETPPAVVFEENKSSVAEKFILINISLLWTFLFWRLSRKIQHYLDRKYYRGRVDYRRASNEISEIVSKNIGIDEIAALILNTIVELVHLKRAGVIFFKNGDKIQFQKYHGFDCIESDAAFAALCKNNYLLFKSFFETEKGNCRTDYLPDEIRQGCIDAGFQYVIPVYYKESVLGAIFVGEKLSEDIIRNEDLNFLSTIAGHTSVAVENSILFDELARRERMRQEVEIARRIQLASLPDSVPDVRGLDISGVSIPAFEVGGDFYDFITNDNESVTVIIGDVSGKGTSAALYMSRMQGIIRTLYDFSKSPVDLFSKSNRQMQNYLAKGSFVTALGGQFDTIKHKLSVTRAGHLPLFILKKDSEEVELISPRGIALGFGSVTIFENVTEEITIDYTNGDFFVFISDGVTEARNENGEDFGYDRLFDLMIASRSKNAESIRTVIVDELRSFIGNTQQYDDLTVVVVKAVD